MVALNGGHVRCQGDRESRGPAMSFGSCTATANSERIEGDAEYLRPARSFDRRKHGDNCRLGPVATSLRTRYVERIVKTVQRSASSDGRSAVRHGALRNQPRQPAHDHATLGSSGIKPYYYLLQRTQESTVCTMYYVCSTQLRIDAHRSTSFSKGSPFFFSSIFSCCSTRFSSCFSPAKTGHVGD